MKKQKEILMTNLMDSAVCPLRAGKLGHEYAPKTQKNKRLLKRESATKKIWCAFFKEKDDTINN